MKREEVRKLAYETIEYFGIPKDALIVAIGASEYARYSYRPMGHYEGRIIHKDRPGYAGFVVGKYLKRDEEVIKATTTHEIGHILFPEKPEWWVVIFGHRFYPTLPLGTVRGAYRHLSEVPSKEVLLKMTRERAHARYGF